MGLVIVAVVGFFFYSSLFSFHAVNILAKWVYDAKSSIPLAHKWCKQVMSIVHWVRAKKQQREDMKTSEYMNKKNTSEFCFLSTKTTAARRTPKEIPTNNNSAHAKHIRCECYAVWIIVLHQHNGNSDRFANAYDKIWHCERKIKWKKKQTALKLIVHTVHKHTCNDWLWTGSFASSLLLSLQIGNVSGGW